MGYRLATWRRGKWGKSYWLIEGIGAISTVRKLTGLGNEKPNYGTGGLSIGGFRWLWFSI